MQRDAYTMTRISREATNTNNCVNMIVRQNIRISSVDIYFKSTTELQGKSSGNIAAGISGDFAITLAVRILWIMHERARSKFASPCVFISRSQFFSESCLTI